MPIHPTAIIDPTAQVHDSVEVGPHAVIEANAVVGEGTVLMTGAVVRANTIVGSGNTLYAYAVLGDDPQIRGFDPKARTRLRVGDRNVFREFFTAHRGWKDGDETVIGDDCYLMTGAHVAHDCRVGNNVTMVNGAGVSGHCIVEEGAFLSGYVAVHQWVRIGRQAMLGGHSGISQDVPPFVTTRGAVAFLVGLNAVGLRRGGTDAETRKALKRAYHELFRSGRSIRRSCAAIRDSYGGAALPAELEHLLAFCEAPSKRGVMSGRLGQRAARLQGDTPDGEPPSLP